MVHRLSDLCDLNQTFDRKMHPTIHHLQDLLELQKVLLLCRDQWICIEERDNHFSKIVSTMNVETEQIFFVIVVSAVSIDASASKELLYELES